MTCPTISSAAALLAAFALAAGAASGASAQDGDQGGAIEVEQLRALDPFEVGLPGLGLDGDPWAASDAAMAARILRDLPGAGSRAVESGSLNSLTASILAGGGEPPRGGRGDHDLAALRANRLLASGGADIVHDLLTRTPGVTQHAGLARLHAETGFARGELQSACATARSLTDGRDAAYWLRARALCAVMAGQGAQAEINADLARTAQADENFDSLLFTLTLQGEVEETARAVDGMTYAMFELAGAAPVLGEDAPGWLRRREMRALRAAITPSAQPVADLVAADEAEGEERDRLLQSVMAQGMDRVAAAQAFGQMLSAARGETAFLSLARRHGGEVASLPVTIDTIDYGVDFVFAALVAGDVRAAERWRQALIDGPPPPPPPAITLAPGQQPGLPGGEPTLSEPAMPEPAMSDQPAQPEWTPPSPRRLVAIDLALAVASDRMRGDGFAALIEAWRESRGLDALPELAAIASLGGEAPAGLRADLYGQPATPAPARLAVMDAAARDNARAEAALLAVLALRESEGALSADIYARSLSGLDEAGARDAALGLIVERIAAAAR